MKYPIGIQDFEKLRTNGYSYVDKSRFVYKLATEGEYYFLSRPRRFGKSLFLSTLEAYFQGKKELFEGLAIYDLETEWKKYPIFHIDLNTANVRTGPESVTGSTRGPLYVLAEEAQEIENAFERTAIVHLNLARLQHFPDDN